MSVYLDHAATSPLRPEAREAWLAASETVGNASSIHNGGQAARRVLESARERLAAVLGCEPIEIVYTSGGTEAVNLALKGLWWARPAGRSGIVLPDAEHHSSIDAIAWLRDVQGASVRQVAVTGEAGIDPARFAAAMTDDVAFATAIAANNESGTVNDVPALVAAARDAPLHVDAVAALGAVPVDFAGWRAHGALAAMSVSAHKIGGPPSIGALVVSRTAQLGALHHGGAAQRGLRAGTADIAGAAAFAVAAERAEADRVREAIRLAALRDALVCGVRAAVPEAVLLGSAEHRLPGNAQLLFPGASGESLLFLLDQAGIAVSTGSACQAGVAEPSHVVLAMGRPERDARSVLRITLGRTSDERDVAAFLGAIGDAYARAGGRR